MRILIISKDCDSSGLAHRLAREGNDVRFFVEAEHFDKVCCGFGVKRCADWEKDLSWVGKTGLIIFDYTGFGEIQDRLRAEGYAVVGGSGGGERLELERDFAYQVLEASGLNPLPMHHFKNVGDAVRFVSKNRGPWVVKHNGDVDKTLTYVGRSRDDRDVLDLLGNYKKNHAAPSSIVLQKRVEGVEIAVARFFNGHDWVGPIEINIEHKDLFNGDLGPKTGEMGTLLWYIDTENNRLFQETLARLKPYLQKTDFRGNIDINCIVNETGIYPLEITARFGYPAISLEYALTVSPFGEFLKALADGKNYPVQWRKGFGVVVQIAVPPFPYLAVDQKYSSEGLRILFSDPLTEEEQTSLHFCDVLQRKNRNGDKEYILQGVEGYALCVTGIGRTVREAREKAYGVIEKIIIPKMFYRTDIGLKFMEKDGASLREWGYV